jgi:hypothetical protein
VTTTAPFALAHARSTCSGATFSRAAIAPTTPRTGPSVCVSGLRRKDESVSCARAETGKETRT